MTFSGKVIIVTGASSGIGADAARFLASLGGNLSIVGRNEKLLHEVADEIKNSASTVPPLVIVADVTKDAEKIINDTVEHFGKLDVLINNAGIYQRDSVVDFNVEIFDSIINTNLKAVALLTSLAVPHLEKTKGNIVNISSVAGIRSLPDGFLSYCLSKAALDQFTLLDEGKAIHPIGRIGDVSDTSAAIAYLACESSSSSFITGILLPVDGGYVVK